MNKHTLLLLMCLMTLVSFGQKIYDYVESGDMKKTSKWLSRQEKISISYQQVNDFGDSADLNIIEWAAFFNQEEIVELFIANREKFVHYDEWISKAFAASIHNCNLSLSMTLYNQGASFTEKCRMCYDASILGLAIAYGCDELYEWLRLQGCPVYTPGAGYDAIHSAAGHSDSSILIDLVDNEHLNVNQQGVWISYPIYRAVRNGRLFNIGYLVSKGAFVNCHNEEGFMPLHSAGDLKTFMFLENLLTEDSSRAVNFEIANIMHPLIMTVISADDRQFFDYFVEKYPDWVHSVDFQGRNAMFALLDADEQTAYFYDELKKRGVSCQVFDQYGGDVEFYARQMKNKKLLKLIKNCKRGQ